MQLTFGVVCESEEAGCNCGDGCWPPFVSSVVAFAFSLVALPHPCPPLGTKLIFGLLPLFSLFRLGRFAGGGIRRPVPTFPKDWSPCLGCTKTFKSKYLVEN